MSIWTDGRDFWTRERMDELTRLWNEGWPTAEIGRRMGITKNAAVGKASRIGLRPRPSPIKRRNAPMAARAWKPPASSPKAAPGARQCSWPIGHPGDKGFRFCDAAPEPGRPYCPEHVAIAHQKPVRTIG